MNIKIVQDAVKEDSDAMAFLVAMAQVLHWWDDLIDRDKEQLDEHTHRMMWLALVEIPGNPFYRKHMASLMPILVNAIANWRIANVVEREATSSKDELQWTFITRSSYVDLVTMCAVLKGGVEHAVAIGPELRRWAHGETFKGYLENLSAEFRARKESNDVL